MSLLVMRDGDRRADEQAMDALRPGGAAAPRTFDPAMVADLPEPARRYFLYAITPGAPLRLVADIEMTGQLSLGSKAKPNYLSMTGRQVLRLDGFVWRVRAGGRGMWFSGSDGYADGEGWTRFWLYDAIPIVREGGGDDIARSAAGRAVAESLFWAPAALLPSEQVRWEAVDGDTARAIVTVAGHEHRVELTVDPDGRPRSVSLMRWSRENPEKTWRLQPFGGTIEAILEVDGYRVAEAVDGGNWFGTPDYFPFYKARVTRISLHPG
ncbi:hypothetical protein LRS10_15900 [Phenylobacterium sp. J426]|uniref:DUF6544 family protein n=1 Tax=Phenylobacterium sp. J426 TaxID=2898439 RepID=UPI0021508563|nr:DUF6544 family protein [Phenylobacterium sp. J426]MCR5875534.1 hypothetical protein [Phenylobacterium sp. J426]